MPTRKTRQLAAERGWLIATAEYYNQYTKRRHDLFGFIDLVALDGQNIIGVQATSGPNVGSRLTKIRTKHAAEATAWLKSGGRILVFGWRKLSGNNRLQYREVEIVLGTDGLEQVEL